MLGKINSTPVIQNKLSSKGVYINDDLPGYVSKNSACIPLIVTDTDYKRATQLGLPVTNTGTIDVYHDREDKRFLITSGSEVGGIAVLPNEPSYPVVRYFLSQAQLSTQRQFPPAIRAENRNTIAEILDRSHV